MEFHKLDLRLIYDVWVLHRGMYVLYHGQQLCVPLSQSRELYLI